MLLGLIILPDANALLTDDEAGWRFYDTACQLRNAVFCLLPFLLPRTYGIRVALCASALWYVGQAIDEAVWGNAFHDGIWEYPFLAFCCLVTYFIIHRHDKQGDPIP